MRISLIPAVFGLLLALSASARADDARPSSTVCDLKRLGSRELAECLRAASDKLDKELTETVAAAVKSIDGRPGLLSGQRKRWARSLNDSQSQWIAWRDTECQDVAPFEAGMAAKGGDPRLACMIDEDSRRIADLKGRYP